MLKINPDLENWVLNICPSIVIHVIITAVANLLQTSVFSYDSQLTFLGNLYFSF